MPGKKTKLEKGLAGTKDVFSDLGMMGKSQSGLDDDVFGFKGEVKGKDVFEFEGEGKKKKGKKGKKDSVEDSIGNIYGDFDL